MEQYVCKALIWLLRKVSPRLTGSNLTSKSMLLYSLVDGESLPTTITTTITNFSAVCWRREKEFRLLGRPEINYDRILTFVRDRAYLLARSSARFILSLFIAESLLFPFLSFIFAHLNPPGSAGILAVIGNGMRTL